tara:strand:+ start:301 stop:582 length:282 start_codon:yes stop_codon:yes gene_type:complete
MTLSDYTTPRAVAPISVTHLPIAASQQLVWDGLPGGWFTSAELEMPPRQANRHLAGLYAKRWVNRRELPSDDSRYNSRDNGHMRWEYCRVVRP